MQVAYRRIKLKKVKVILHAIFGISAKFKITLGSIESNTSKSTRGRCKTNNFKNTIFLKKTNRSDRIFDNFFQTLIPRQNPKTHAGPSSERKQTDGITQRQTNSKTNTSRRRKANRDRAQLYSSLSLFRASPNIFTLKSKPNPILKEPKT